jgi:carbonic anhydrase
MGRDGGVNRATFLASSLAALAAAHPLIARSDASSGPGVPPNEALARLMDGNQRFVAGDFPPITSVAEKRAMLVEHQEPFAAILSCSDSRVIPDLLFVAGLGKLFVVRVAGNYPDDMVMGSLEYSVEHLGTRLVMVLGHENCGAVKAVYSSVEAGKSLPPHLSAIEQAMAPGIQSVVQARGSIKDATIANVRAAVAKLSGTSPSFAQQTKSGRIRIVGGYYALTTGKVTLVA